MIAGAGLLMKFPVLLAQTTPDLARGSRPVWRGSDARPAGRVRRVRPARALRVGGQARRSSGIAASGQERRESGNGRAARRAPLADDRLGRRAAAADRPHAHAGLARHRAERGQRIVRRYARAFGCHRRRQLHPQRHDIRFRRCPHRCPHSDAGDRPDRHARVCRSRRPPRRPLRRRTI